MKRNKILILISLSLSLVMAACGFGHGGAAPGDPGINAWTEYDLPDHAYHDQMDGRINHDLFFFNDLSAPAPDPSVIYVPGEDGARGWFYMYATSDVLGASGFQAWRSQDMSRWEDVGVVFTPPRNGWARANFWAPEVMYHQGTFYMFYNAWDARRADNRHSIGLAVSNSPSGPFVSPTHVNGNGDQLSYMSPLVDSHRFPLGSGIHGQAIIDASPFIDRNWCNTEGEYVYTFYLFFTLDIQLEATQGSLWGMRMQDFYTPVYETAVQLTRFNFATMECTTPMGYDNLLRDNRANVTNEAPFMWRNGDTYFFTFSTAQFYQYSYSVLQATGPSPLGPFTKVPLTAGGLLLTSRNIDYAQLGVGFAQAPTDNYAMRGVGHHSFVQVGDELFILYHAITGRNAYRAEWSPTRAAAMDRIHFIDNGHETIMYVNGPTHAIQPLPVALSGYRNLALEATVTATNVRADSHVRYLNNGIFLNYSHNRNIVRETVFDNGSTEILLTFDDKVNVRAVMIYNSNDIMYSFEEIEQISFATRVDNQAGHPLLDGWLNINNLQFDMARHISTWGLGANPDWDAIRNDPNFFESFSWNLNALGRPITRLRVTRPGAAAVAEFDAITTNQIRIRVNAAPERAGVPQRNLAIADIVVLGN